MSTHYDILRVSPDATAQEIKAAFRFQLKAFHPDKFPTNSEAARLAQNRVREIIEAHAVLSDHGRRINYDRFLRYTSVNHSPSDAASTTKEGQAEQRPSRLIYLSTSPGYDEVEQTVVKTLATLNCGVVHRPGRNHGQDLRPAIRKQVDLCDAVLQLVGRAYGDEPPTADPLLGRMSYMHFEAAYARERRKPIHYALLAEQIPVSRIISEPDDGARLQENYVRRLKIVDSHTRTQVNNVDDLTKAVRLFALSLRGCRTRKTRSLLWAAAFIVLLLLAVIIKALSSGDRQAASPRVSDPVPTASGSLKPVGTPPLFASNASTPASKLSVTPHPEVLNDGSLLQITEAELSPTDQPDLTLRLAIAARSKTGIDFSKVRVQVVFYDSVNQKITPTTAAVSYEWFAGSPDWKHANPEQLRVRYRRDDKSHAKKGQFLGYIVWTYYSDVLQEVRADPVSLLKVFPRPETILSSSDSETADAIARGDFVEAAKLYREASDTGDVSSKRELARLYELGLGVPRNYYQAVALYNEAAERGYVKAIYDLGRMYYDGAGVIKDYGKAAELFDKAGAQNDAQALVALAWMRLRGDGVEQNDDVAAALLLKAIEQRYAPAERMLGSLYTTGQGVSQDYSKALDLFQDAAAQGDVEALLRLASVYKDGKGVAVDPEKAVDLYRLLISKYDHPIAAVNLGWMYEIGDGVAKDDSKAMELYQKAASQGYPPGIAQLASCYAFGKGTPIDYPKARDLFDRAVASGDGYALNDFAWFLATCPEPSQRDGKQAVKFAIKACDQSNWKDANEIGTLAAAYAEAGDFSKAAKFQEWAMTMIDGNFPDPKQMKEMLVLFKQKKPYRNDGSEPTTDIDETSNLALKNVAELEGKWAEAVRTRDPGVVENLLTEDFTSTTPSGRRLSRSDTVNRLRSDSDQYASVELSNFNCRWQGDQIIATGLLDERGHLKNGVPFHRTFSFVDTWVQHESWWFCKKSEVRTASTSGDSAQGAMRRPKARKSGPQQSVQNRRR